MPILSLFFVSRSCVPTDGNEPPLAVRQLVEDCRVSNISNGITGALVWTPLYFGEVIEGDAQIIRELYIRITSDKRHKEVVLVDSQVPPQREYNGWMLAYSGGSRYVQDRLAKLHAQAGRPMPIEATLARRLIRGLAGENRGSR